MNLIRFRNPWSTYFFLPLSVICLLIGTPSTYAAVEMTNEQLVALVQELQGTVQTLESKVAVLEGSPSPEGNAVGVPRVTGGDIVVDGFIDTSLNWNMEDPAGTAFGGNNGPHRAFDNNANTFDLNNAEIMISRAPAESDNISAGFSTVFMYGSDATNSDSGGFDTADEFAIQQAYLEVHIPQVTVFDDGLTVIAGKFATLQGAEVIENHLNWNASRSILFFNAIPFTHVGVRASGTIMDGLFSMDMGLVNGWDIAIDNNDIKDFESRFGWNPSENFNASAGFMLGSQTIDDAGSPRGLVDVIVYWKPLPEALPGLETMLNFDYGWEEDLGLSEGGTADWQGYALYSKYTINDQTAVAYRFEQFWDDQQARITAADKWYSHTFNADRWLTDDVLVRAEFRHDHTDSGLALDGATKDHQNTAMLSAIYMLG